MKGYSTRGGQVSWFWLVAALVEANLIKLVTPLSVWAVSNRLDRTDASKVMEELLPAQQYSDRIGLGRQAQGIGGEDRLTPMKADDPRLAMTYAEFPLESLDVLLDAAMKYMRSDSDGIEMVDIGSGLGRIVVYAALSRGTQQLPWHVSGVEISSLLHQQALSLAQEGTKQGKFVSIIDLPQDGRNSFSLLQGKAADYSDSMLLKADIVFAYSTAFNAKSFDPEIGALILDTEWSEMLAEACHDGCVAVTTDRALDPYYGWKLLERIDVTNPEVFGSTGYIHMLVKRS